jgi:hypothetical protein
MPRGSPARHTRNVLAAMSRNKSGFVGVNLFYALKDSVLVGIQALFSNFSYCRSSLQTRLSQQTSPQ